MALTVDEPKLRTRREINARVLAVREVLKHMRHGGTANDVRSVLIDLKSITADINTVKCDLWLLHDLGIVRLKESDDGGLWWFLPRDQSCPLPRSA